MEPSVNISYTLRLVLDDLKSRLSQLTQNVTSYDHLLYVQHELRDESPFHAVREHYGKISGVQEKIREEVRHINTQLRTLYDERTSSENDRQKKAWIVNTSINLRNEFEQILTKLRVMQQNFIQSHKSKVFDLERQLDPSNYNNGEVQQKIALYRDCLNRFETDIHVNGQTMDQLKNLIVAQESAESYNNYDTVEISPRVTEIHQIPVDPPQGGVTIQQLKRRQNLILVVIVALVLMLIVTLILIA